MSGIKGPVVAIGSVCYDEYYTAPAWPPEGDKVMITPGPRIVGGMIANAASVFAGYGADTYLLDSMNGGENNRALLRDLEGFGIKTSHVHFDAAIPDARCLIVQTPAERTILVVERGIEGRVLTAEQHSLMRSAAVVYTTMAEFTKFENAPALAKELKESGTLLAFDVEPSTFGTTEDPLFGVADILCFNKQGFERYAAGCDQKVCIQKLLEGGAKAVTITLGKDGCYGKTLQVEQKLPAIDLPVVDTTGAGDTFNASFVYGFASGRPFGQALRFANAAANHAVTVMGARGGVAKEQQVYGWMKEYGMDEERSAAT